MATTINLTNAWTRIDTQVTVNSGFLVTGGNVELSTTLNPPSSTDTGTIIKRNNFFNLYPSIVTYARSTTTTSKILIDTSFLNFKLREFVISNSAGTKYSINLDTLTLTVTLNTGPMTAANPTVTQIMAYIPTILTPYGLQLFSFGIRSNLITAYATTNGNFYNSFIAVDSESGTFRLLNAINKTTLEASVCQLLTGNLVLELLLI